MVSFCRLLDSPASSLFIFHIVVNLPTLFLFLFLFLQYLLIPFLHYLFTSHPFPFHFPFPPCISPVAKATLTLSASLYFEQVAAASSPASYALFLLLYTSPLSITMMHIFNNGTVYWFLRLIFHSLDSSLYFHFVLFRFIRITTSLIYLFVFWANLSRTLAVVSIRKKTPAPHVPPPPCNDILLQL